MQSLNSNKENTTSNLEWTELQMLLKEIQMPLWRYGTTYIGVLTILYLCVEAWVVFGVGEQIVKDLGYWGYLLLFLIPGFVTIAWMFGKKLYLSERIVKVLSTVIKKLPPRIDYLALLQNESANRAFEWAFLTEIPCHPQEPAPFSKLIKDQEGYTPLRCALILSLLRDIGVINIDSNLQIRPVSTLAGGFIRSMALHIKEEITFMGDWEARGSENIQAQGIRRIVRQIEERRVEVIGADKAEPSRYTKAVIVMIKAKYKNEDVYLMQWSTSWTPARFWFIGGIVEPYDNDLQSSVCRELNEELGLIKPDIMEIRQVCSTKDRRISGRLGLYTEYEYIVFFVSLNTKREQVRELFQLEPEVKTPLDWTLITRISRWLRWEEIYNEPSLQQDASVLLNELDRVIASLPPSSSIVIPYDEKSEP